MSLDLTQYGINNSTIHRNLSPAVIYEHALEFDGANITASGALASISFEKTGRSPKDKRIVRNPESENEIWWGPVNIPLEADSFAINRKMAVEFLSECDQLYIVDGYAGWDPAHQLKIRIICARPYHALFMHNMLIRPTAEQLSDFGEPDYVILNSGQCKADTAVEGVESDTSITLNLESKELVILGSQYAGEMKKGVFTIMHYLMPRQNIFSMHCSANEGEDGTVALFFGLSGTGKTTLSADANRPLIGDDEHCWTDNGVFNIEGGCYAKTIDLSAESEPEIYQAIRFGTVLENVVYDQDTRAVDYTNVSITQNTRASYPIEYIDNAKIPCVGAHPKNIILLTCDAFGVLPPVSKLTPAQASYHFINGYTAKVAGTEVGVTEPEATFSACFGAAFLMLHPVAYGTLLAEKMQQHNTNAWLVNTGWSGGAYGTGERMSLKYTRAIIDAIHAGQLDDVATVTEPVFGLAISKSVPGCPSDILVPSATWSDSASYEQTAAKLAQLFTDNFAQYLDQAEADVVAAGPTVSGVDS